MYIQKVTFFPVKPEKVVICETPRYEPYTVGYAKHNNTVFSGCTNEPEDFLFYLSLSNSSSYFKSYEDFVQQLKTEEQFHWYKNPYGLSQDELIHAVTEALVLLGVVKSEVISNG